jgi:predicted esterase
MSSPFLTSVPTLITRTDGHAQQGTIDDTSNMAGDKVYVFHGTRDTTVNNKNGEQIVTFYENYLSSSDIATEFSIAAEHCQVTILLNLNYLNE